MITISVTSDTDVPELYLVRDLINSILDLRSGKTGDDKNVINVKLDASAVRKTIDEAVAEFGNTLVNGLASPFNAAELAEAEQLGKPVCSTADVSQSTTAHVGTQVNTSLPEPTSVFGQPAQTTENVANPVVQTTDNPVRDAEGRLWDERIHSSSKELVKNGTWRKRRGVSEELIMQVDAEVLGIPMNTPVVEAQIPYAPAPPVTPPAPVTTEMTFTELLDGVTKAMVAGTLSQAKIAAALDSVGLTALPHLLGNTALIPAFREALGGVV